MQFAHGNHDLRPVPRHPKYKTEVNLNWILRAHIYYYMACFKVLFADTFHKQIAEDIGFFKSDEYHVMNNYYRMIKSLHDR